MTVHFWWSLHSRLVCENRDIVLLGFQGMLASGEIVLLTWQLSVLWKSLSIRDWRFLTLILRCWPICMQRSCGRQNEKDIQRISCTRVNHKWMIPFCVMVNVAVRNPYYADCILVTRGTTCMYSLWWIAHYRTYFYRLWICGTAGIVCFFHEYSPDNTIKFLKCTNLFSKMWQQYCAFWKRDFYRSLI